GTILLSITSAAQAVPSIAVIAVVFIFVGIGSTPAIFALFLYSLVPIVFNTASGLLSVPNATKESATGMGMTKRQILTKVELPISVPSILSGVRSAATINIGTATIASAIGAGGLGELIFIGLKLMREEMIIAGALPAALLAILIDTALAFAESGITSKGIKLQN
ncbi:MAG: ABC transporter permease, partial [Spirochaetia bacterium]